MSNSYDEKYIFRKAVSNDIESIMSFIANNWNKDHLMANNKNFFNYEFVEDDGSVNFILAIDKEKQTIECINGYLKASHCVDCMDIWGSIWKVRDGNMGMLGVELIRRRKELTGCRCDLDVGDNPKTAIPVLKVLLKRYTAKMNHYYILARHKNYKIASIQFLPKFEYLHEFEHEVVKLNNFQDLKRKFNCEKYINNTPYKDYWYINHRFYQHPVYKYDVYGIINKGVVDAVIVFRNQKYKDRIAIRFVDYIGDKKLISGIGGFLSELLVETKGAEYIDFYCSGLEESFVLAAGFTKLSKNDKNIIPNYFEPFEQKNIDIWVDSRNCDSLFTKADADQDRPSLIK